MIAGTGKPIIPVEPNDGRKLRGWRTKERIVEAARALFDEGLYDTGAREIADRARVSTRSVYQHFTSLSDLWARAVSDEQAAAAAARVRAMSDREIVSAVMSRRNKPKEAEETSNG